MDIFTMIVVALLCAPICYYLAESKGHNGILAAILALFLGVFAVICYALMGKTVEKQALDQLALERKLAQFRSWSGS
jgi:hypothetical protein